MRFLTSNELAFVSGGGWGDEDDLVDNPWGRSSPMDSFGGEYNPVLVATIAAVGLVTAAIITNCTNSTTTTESVTKDCDQNGVCKNKSTKETVTTKKG